MSPAGLRPWLCSHPSRRREAARLRSYEKTLLFIEGTSRRRAALAQSCAKLFCRFEWCYGSECCEVLRRRCLRSTRRKSVLPSTPDKLAAEQKQTAQNIAKLEVTKRDIKQDVTSSSIAEGPMPPRRNVPRDTPVTEQFSSLQQPLPVPRRITDRIYSSRYGLTR